MINKNTYILDHKIQEIIRSGQLYDFLALRKRFDRPNNYIRGTQTIDYIFGTTNVTESLQNAGMLPFSQGILSDHCILCINLHIPALFNYKLHDIFT